VTFPAFKAGDSVLRGSNGGFDSHTLPPHLLICRELQMNEAARGGIKGKNPVFDLGSFGGASDNRILQNVVDNRRKAVNDI
jgi:hypothetical protein